MKKDKSSGFTIIELLIATAVFSVVLIVFLTAVLRVSQLFYKGVNMARTQETARTVLQSISDDIRFHRTVPTQFDTYFCVGGHRYTVYKGQQVNDTNHGLLKEELTGCPPITGDGAIPVNTATAVEMLDHGMQVNRLDIDNLSNGAVNLSINIVFYGGDSSVLQPSAAHENARCSGAPSSTQYCATATYTSTILQEF